MGKKVIFRKIDCDDESFTEVVDKFNITDYPTIKLEFENKIYEYDAKPDRNTLNQFLEAIN